MFTRRATRWAVCIGVSCAWTLVLSPSAALGWHWPADGPILRAFLVHDDKYAAGQHRGIDVALVGAAAIRAPVSGEVSFAGAVPTHGLTITIVAPDGHRASLTHLGTLRVRKGASVAEGDPIADPGPTGESEHATPYVHLGIRVGDADTYVDPLGLLPPRSAPNPPPAPAAAPAPTPPPVSAPPPAGAQPEPAPAPAPVPAPSPAPQPAPAPTAAEPTAASTDAGASEVTSASVVRIGAVPGPDDSPNTRSRPGRTPEDARETRSNVRELVETSRSRSISRRTAPAAERRRTTSQKAARPRATGPSQVGERLTAPQPHRAHDDWWRVRDDARAAASAAITDVRSPDSIWLLLAAASVLLVGGGGFFRATGRAKATPYHWRP